MARVLPNPAWINKNSVNPHNYNATKHAAGDSKRAYSRAASVAGKTVGDLLHECKYQRDLATMLRSK